MISYESNPITPGAAVAARCKRVLFATVLVAMTAGLGEISPATAQLDSTFVDLSVTLDLGFVAGFPSAGSQGLRVRLLSQEGSGPAFTTLVPDRKIMDVWPQYPIGHGSTWAEGPFVVRVAREAPAETLRAELAQSFGVAACLLPEENPQLLGEAAEAYFPPEVGSSAESGFCWYQTFLHFSDPEEGPSPTLADANCDECAWFNDGLNASSRVLWQVNGEPGAFDDEYMADSVPVDMDLPQAWAITRGDADIVVAVLDPKGVGWQHPDLSGYQTATGDESLAEAVSQVQSAGGNVYVNPNDPPGLAPGSDPIRPGQAHVDDDLDGLTDEDWFGVQPDSSGALTPEIQMDVLVVSSLTATDTFSIQVAEADWADNQYANWELYMYFTDEIAWGSPSLVARIVGNTSNTLITDPPFGLSIFVYESPSYTNVGWLDWLSDLVNLGYRFVLVDVPSMNGEDDDGDSVPDDIRPYLSFMGADDDESGIVDDVVGYDFNFGASGEVPWGPGATELVDTRAATVNSNSSPNHGTVIAGIIAARHDADGWGAAGVVPNARIMPLLAYSVPAIAAAIKYALSFRNPDGSPVVDVITSSIGSSNAGYGAPLAAYTGLLQALQSAEDQGVLFIQSAENNKQTYPPGTWIWGVDTVVTVGGTSATGGVWTSNEANWGTAYGSDVDIAARATQNLGVIDQQIGDGGSTAADAQGMTPRGRWGHSIWGNTGNSFATPYVAGVAALVKHAYPHYSAAEVRARLYRGTDPITYGAHVPAGGLGYGRLNA